MLRNRLLCANRRALHEAAVDQGSCSCITAHRAYLLAPQWQPRSPEQQFPGSASWPSGPMQVCVMAHQKSPSPERGTEGSGSDQMYWLFQCSAEQSPGRSVLNLSGTLLMLHPLRPAIRLPSEWPASPPPGPDGFCGRCVPGSWLWRLLLLQLHLPWPA
jgi:hypothetical protein